jgi:glucosylceramidase
VPLGAATASVGADLAPLAVDADGSTLWQSKEAIASGQNVQVDLGTARTVRRVALDSGGNLGDYPGTWQLSYSNDGTTWRPLKTGTSNGQLTNVDVSPTRARYLRITSTSASDHWWTLADFRVYS